MNPHVLLKIQNHIPHLYLVNKDSVETRLTQVDENLSELFTSTGSQLNLFSDQDANIENLLDLANESAKDYPIDAPEIDIESLEFQLSDVLQQLHQSSQEIEEDYKEIELDEVLRNELKRNQNLDILASILESVYKVIIAKTLLAAHDLELNEVKFVDEHNYARLRERLGKELDALGVEFMSE